MKELEKRVTILEKTLKKQPINSHEDKQKKQNNFNGLRGGIRYLISQSFLESPKAAKDVEAELKKEGYHYSIQSVDKALRDMMQKQKILTRVMEGNTWKYVVRK